MAGAILWLTNRRDVMGDTRNGWVLNGLGAVGFLLVLLIAIQVVVFKVLPALTS